jgi:Ca-activated chloride channel family protein
MARGSRNNVPVVVAAIAGLLLIFAVRNIMSGDDNPRPPTGAATEQPLPLRSGCVTVSFAASSEKADLVRQMAAEFNKGDAAVDGKCVQIAVSTKASGGAMDALARGWDDAVDGPRPDVWSPASSAWPVLLRQRLSERDTPDIVPAELPNIVQTPLVIAMPRPMAEKLGWPKKPLGWSDIIALSKDAQGWGRYGEPLWGKFRLGKTNPNFSTSGLNATIGTYFAATGLATDLTAADVNNPKTVAYVKDVEASVVHYGDTTLTFLANMLKADDRGQGLTYISAATVEEKSVWDYNKGNPSGNPATLGQHAPPRTPLVAIYPKEGTLISDNPYVVLNAPWVDEAKKKGAALFLAYLQKPEQQATFQKAAFRTFDGKAGAEITEANGMLKDEPKTVISPPAPDVLDLVQKSWNANRKRARVIMVIDISGSMNEKVARVGRSKLELAKEAASKALEQFSPDDELSLWAFSTKLDGDKPYLEIVPRRRVRDGLAEFRSEIGGLTPHGATGLYESTQAAVDAARQQFADDRINAVIVLTDGKQDPPQPDALPRLVSALESEDEDSAIRVFPIAYGDDADLGILRQIADASQGAAYDAKDPATIDRVFTAVVSNF